MKLFFYSIAAKPNELASRHSNEHSFDRIRKMNRRGLSLVEILVALTMTLIVLGAMMTAFQYASQEMASGRAMMELANRVRGAESLLRADLAGVTVEAKPYTQTVNPPGYFEYIEGPVRDVTYAAPNAYLGDIDDVLAMTVRSNGSPFRGRRGNAIIESPLAEVVWFTTFVDQDADNLVSFTESIRLHRRVLLIRPDAGVLLSNANAAAVDSFFQNNDISARLEPATGSNFNVIANSLSDLAIRAHRFCHVPTKGPNTTNQLDRSRLLLLSQSYLDDVVLTDVCAFDVKAYSPNASVNKVTDIVIQPGDPGYAAAGATMAGAYVDLGQAGGGLFASAPDPKSYPGPAAAGHFYDTWTPFYEMDGIDQDGVFGPDQGTDGQDQNGNGVDDMTERETMPPYPAPLRGIKVSIRLIEKGTRQVHQSSIVHSFLPE